MRRCEHRPADHTGRRRPRDERHHPARARPDRARTGDARRDPRPRLRTRRRGAGGRVHPVDGRRLGRPELREVAPGPRREVRGDEGELAATKTRPSARRSSTPPVTGEAEAKAEFSKASRKIATDFDAVREKSKTDYARAKSATSSAFDAGEKEAAAKFIEERRPVDEVSKLIASMHARLAAVFADYQKFGLTEAPRTPTRETYKFEDPVGTIYERLTKADPDLTLLEGLFIPRAMKGQRYLWLFVVVFVLLIYPMWVLSGAGLGARGGRRGRGRGLGFLAADLVLQPLEAAGRPVVLPGPSDAGRRRGARRAFCRSQVEERYKAQRAKVAQRRDEALQQAKQKQAKTVAEGEEQRDDRLRKINQVYAQKMVEIQTKQQVDRREAVEAYDRARPRSAPRTRPRASARSTRNTRPSRRRSARATNRRGPSWRQTGAEASRRSRLSSTRSAARSTPSDPGGTTPPGPIVPSRNRSRRSSGSARSGSTSTGSRRASRPTPGSARASRPDSRSPPCSRSPTARTC